MIDARPLRTVGRCLTVCAALALAAAAAAAEPAHSVARRWNEVLLQAIRNDFARPPVHARNLYHVTVAMWDAWAAYDDTARPVLVDARAWIDERAAAGDDAAARHEAISYAAYYVLYSRYFESPGAYESLTGFDDLMAEFGYDPANTVREGLSPAAIGNRIGHLIIEHGYDDGADELGSYAFEYEYRPANRPMVVGESGAGPVQDPNRWQPLALRRFVDQAGRQQPGNVQRFIGSHWGAVTPFALSPDGMVEAGVYLDPGPPPYLGGDRTREYQTAFAEVLRYGATLSPDDGVLIDISPGARGNNNLGANDGRGHAVNPVTGTPYAPNVVKRGDWSRVIAEFWADGPDSETPPGHWNSLANYVTDHPDTVRRLGGAGAVLDPLDWDLKLYLALNGAVHDAAICAWGLKGRYDYVRPITAVRYMATLGQILRPEPARLSRTRPAALPGTDRGHHRGVGGGRRAPRPPCRARRLGRGLRVARQAGGPGDAVQRRRLAPGGRLAALSARHLRHAAVRGLRLRPQRLQPRRRRGDGALHGERILPRRPGRVGRPRQ